MNAVLVITAIILAFATGVMHERYAKKRRFMQMYRDETGAVRTKLSSGHIRKG